MSEPRRIALDATYSVGDHLSGVGVYSREILNGLARRYPKAAFSFCYRPHRFWRALREPLPANCRRSLLLDPLFAPRRADVFHALNQRLPETRPRRAVTTFHDLFVLTGEYSTPEFRRRFADQARRAAAASDLIITVSAFTAGQVESLLGVERARLRVIRHGVRMPPPSTAPRERVILHVGAIQKRKNIARLVEAFESAPEDWRLVLAGSAGFGSEEILARIESSPARERIARPGYLEAAALSKWYARAEILAFPSLDEGFGIPILEAMAAGAAVLTSNRGGMAEVAGDAALCVDPENSDEIACGLRKLVESESLREQLRRKGLARAAEHTWDRAIEQTWSVYRELV